MNPSLNFALEISNLHWLEGLEAHLDLCAHGYALVRIGDEVIGSPSQEDKWTMSAASFHLLRTLTRDHTPDDRIAEHLIPHCGHDMWELNDGSLWIVGCNSGVDWFVRHKDGDIELESPGGSRVLVPFDDWRDAVLKIADAVEAFYANAGPKEFYDVHDQRGYDLFWREWKAMRSRWPRL
ncbi:MAG: hypothetical protein R2832_19695 [Rhodothermales bacterium]